MQNRWWILISAIVFLLACILVGGAAFVGAMFVSQATTSRSAPVPAQVATIPVQPILPTPWPTATLPTPWLQATPTQPGVANQAALSQVYNDAIGGVVTIRVLTAISGGTGSGFLIDDQGHIVTNNHVVSDATEVVVVFYDGMQVRATVVGTDPYSDLAVIKSESVPEGAHPLPIGSSDALAVGQDVVAIGSPFGLGSTLTTGIVSALGRGIPSGVTQFSIPEAIQTDAAINPGNSGGPLLNMAGEVIGVNAQIASAAGSSSGVGFAIPASVVTRVAPDIIANGSYDWAWLGVQMRDVGLFVAQANSVEQGGAYVSSVIPGGPAERAGLQGSSGQAQVDGQQVPTGGDIIIAYNGQPVADSAHLLAVVAEGRPGETATLRVLRDGAELELPVTLGSRDEMPTN